MWARTPLVLVACVSIEAWGGRSRRLGVERYFLPDRRPFGVFRAGGPQGRLLARARGDSVAETGQRVSRIALGPPRPTSGVG